MCCFVYYRVLTHFVYVSKQPIRCPGGRRAWPTRGYWATGETSGVAEVCASPSSARCPNGMIHGTQATDDQCQRNYTGVRCGKCSDGFYVDPASQMCLSCTPGAASGNTALFNETSVGQKLAIAAPIMYVYPLIYIVYPPVIPHIYT